MKKLVLTSILFSFFITVSVHAITFLGGASSSTTLTNGSVIFSNGSIFTENNSKIFWDNNNYRLGINTTVPSRSLDVNGRAKILSIETPISTLADAATVTPDFGVANQFKLVLGGSRALGVPTNVAEGQTGVITVIQDSTGSRTLTYAWPYIFSGLSAPTLSTGKFSMDQLSYVVNAYSTSTITMTVATPCVVTWTGHGLVSGQRLAFTTTGALPTGLSVNTGYYVNVINTNTFNVSSSLANLQSGTYIATTGGQSGSHTGTVMSISIVLNPNMGQ
jgi:hypothetical protein